MRGSRRPTKPARAPVLFRGPWMRHLARLAAALAAAAALMSLTPLSRAADTTAPPTPLQPVTDSYHRVEAVDPSRWMEDMTTPQWKTWLRAQADHAQDVLSRIPGRAALRQRL